jgi:predicted MFS family arabinose efflux permease
MLLLLSFAWVDPALANRLSEAANRGSNMVLSLAQTTSGVGIALGAILLSLGVSHFGKTVLTGGVMGAFLTFGGPAIVDFVKGLF